MGELFDQEPLRTALVLDDEEQIGAIVCRVLTALGMAAKQFTEPLQYLLEVKRSPPDLLILDLALGRVDAVDVMRQLDVLKFGGKVLLISGRDEVTLREMERIGLSHGLRMLQSLQKPFRAPELKARLQASPEQRVAAPEIKPPPAKKSPSCTLAEALENNWLEVWYQPKIDLKSLSVCGAEALIRARHPQGGIVEPATLLPPPGDALYKPLTFFVIRRALSDWQLFAGRERPIKLAINLPASILSAPGFVDWIRNVLPPTPKFPGLIVEVTEDEVIDDLDWMHEVATQLRLYNVSISIDDFGSAYASLSRIKDLPFREIKLDRSFVTNCASDALKRSLCQMVVDLAHCFDASACAEGVETVEELRCLVELGFDTAQGYIFARPMPCAQFLEFIVKVQDDPRAVRPDQPLASPRPVRA